MMKNVIRLFIIVSMLYGCDKKNDDLVLPIADFPQVFKFDDEGDGDLEDEDHFSFTITLNDRVDNSGKEPAGTVVPLDAPATIHFEVSELEGFETLSDYIKGWKAFYEIDDCTESDNLQMDFDPATGTGSVQFPAGVQEIIVEFETDDSFFDDDEVNDGGRNLSVVFTGVDAGENIVVNEAVSFTYEVLDDETVHGDWELDVDNAEQFAAFKTLFGMVNEDIAALNAEDVEKIEISIEYNELSVVVELKETEMLEECGVTEEVNKTIEIEMDIEELELNTTSGEIELSGDNFTYNGEYAVEGEELQLLLAGENGNDETDEITLLLRK